MSSKRRLRRKECERKKRFATKHEASLGALGATRRGVDRLRVYRCRFCGGWHMGHWRRE